MKFNRPAYVVPIVVVVVYVTAIVLIALNVPTFAAPRRLDIPFRGSCYDEFDTQVIRSQVELDNFLERIAGHVRPTNDLGELTDGLRAAGVNFEKEVLVLVRHTEGSGSVDVVYQRPYRRGQELVCPIVTRTPFLCTCDMADYCVACVVPRRDITTVTVEVKRELGWPMVQEKKPWAVFPRLRDEN